MFTAVEYAKNSQILNEHPRNKCMVLHLAEQKNKNSHSTSICNLSSEISSKESEIPNFVWSEIDITKACVTRHQIEPCVWFQTPHERKVQKMMH